MPTEIIIPRLGWSMEEGAFVAWLKQDGEFVRAGDPLFSIEGDKAIQEIESLDSGILRIASPAPQAGQSIRVGDVLGHLLSAEEAASGQEISATVADQGVREPASLPKAEVIPASPIPAASAPSNATHAPTADPITAHRPVRCAISPRAVRVAGELGIDWTTVAGTGRTGRIRERDIRMAAGRQPRPIATSSASSPGPDPTKPTVLVTGGAGFIGTWVVRELCRRGLPVVVLDVGPRPPRWERIIGPGHEDIPLIQASLLDRDHLMAIFAGHGVTHVIHLAALLTPACQVDPWEGCQVNVMGTLALLEQLRVSGDRIRGFSYASSVAAFGEEPDHAAGRPGAENLPVTFYGAFKKSIEMFAEQYWRHFGVASVGVRPQVVYGPERDVGLTAGPSLAAKAAALGQPYRIGYTGRIGYDYVEDVARAFVRGALETPPGAAVVDLPGEMKDVDEVVTAIVQCASASAALLTVEGPIIPVHLPPRPRWISTLYPDWQSTPLSEGMRRTVDFYRTQSNPL